MLIVFGWFLGTINYSCMNASSPVQDKGSIANESIFDRNNIFLTLYVIGS